MNNGTPELEQHIGHISAPIEDNDVQQMQIILNHHNVYMRRSRSENPDNWWFLLLPDGTVKIPRELAARLKILGCLPVQE